MCFVLVGWLLCRVLCFNKVVGTFAQNQKAQHDYQALETFEAGLELLGHEVKAIEQGKLQLAGSFVAFKKGELYLVGATLPPYQPNNTPADYEPQRPRKLLLHKRELEYLLGKSKEKGLTLVPLRVYSSKAKMKLAFALARGKRKGDKRELLKKRETQREIERALKKG